MKCNCKRINLTKSKFCLVLGERKTEKTIGKSYRGGIEWRVAHSSIKSIGTIYGFSPKSAKYYWCIISHTICDANRYENNAPLWMYSFAINLNIRFEPYSRPIAHFIYCRRDRKVFFDTWNGCPIVFCCQRVINHRVNHRRICLYIFHFCSMLHLWANVRKNPTRLQFKPMLLCTNWKLLAI